ncbi:MAG: hypothetical protein JWR26_916, partial [Pedosphaera sp.]|nr:hypothetical protein [Pedosphaera sp.]
FFNNAGTVRKTGGTGVTSFDYQLPFNNFGTLSVLQGTLNFQGSLALSNGKLNFGLISSSSFGQINISGNVTLSGAVSATLLGGFVPSLGNTFPVVTYGSHTGVFTNIILPPGLDCGADYSSTKFTLTVLSVRPVIVPTMVMSGTSNQAPVFMLQFTGSTNSTYTVMASTNLAIPFSNWAILGTASLLSNNLYQFIDTSSTNLPSRFYRLRSP